MPHRSYSLRSFVGILAVIATVALVWIPETRSIADEPAVEARKAETTGTPEKANPAKPAADPMIGDDAGQVRDDNGLTIKLVWCPPGVVRMECVDSDGGELAVVPKPAPVERRGVRIEIRSAEEQAGPLRTVNAFVSRGFWIGKYEITRGEWRQVMQTTPWIYRVNENDEPFVAATYIGWHDAMEFCRRLTVHERRAGRLPVSWEYTLPTEAQWERACRARTETQYSFGDDPAQLGDYAWFDVNGNRPAAPYPHRVGQKKPNPWGLHDMHGNVREWCRDVFAEQLPGGRDPEVETGGPNRVCRGGNVLLPAWRCRSSARDSAAPNSPLAFRIALSPIQATQEPARERK